MKSFETQIPILLEFRGMETPVTVTLPPPVMRYLDIFADRNETQSGEVVYKQCDRNRVMPECFLPRRTADLTRQ